MQVSCLEYQRRNEQLQAKKVPANPLTLCFLRTNRCLVLGTKRRGKQSQAEAIPANLLALYFLQPSHATLPYDVQVSRFEDPHEACISVVTESYRQWLEHETRTDDISMIVVQVSGFG